MTSLLSERTTAALSIRGTRDHELRATPERRRGESKRKKTVVFHYEIVAGQRPVSDLVKCFEAEATIRHQDSLERSVKKNIADEGFYVAFSPRFSQPFIRKDKIDNPKHPGTIRERLDDIDRFTRDNPGKPVSSFILENFALEFDGAQTGRGEVKTLREGDVVLPEEAPAFWEKARRPKELAADISPPEFIRLYYAPWIGKGLTTADIRRFDRQLYMALHNWLRTNEMPADVDLPTLKQQNDRWIERARKGDDLPIDGTILQRVGGAMKRRGQTERE
jgi:hypothetical protein